MRICKIACHLTAPDNTIWSWSDEKPEQHMEHLFVRIFTDEGVEGVAGIPLYSAYGHDKSVAEAIITLGPVIIGKDPLRREKIWEELRLGYIQLPASALSAIDIALWDIAGKVAGLPLYKLLGGHKEHVPAYASTPTFPTLEQYYAFVEEMGELGFPACKFHVWGNPQADIQLIKGVTHRFARDMTFMFDAEGTYSHEAALKVGRVLDEASWNWYEMPLPDYDWTGYRKLCDALDIAVIPGGFWLTDLLQYGEAFKREIWDRARVNAALTGGLTLAHKVVALAEAFGRPVEIECFGFTLAQAAGLHLTLASKNCHIFEMPVPYGPFDAFMLDTLRADKDGLVHAPTKPGLGFDVDWPAVQSEAIASWEHAQ